MRTAESWAWPRVLSQACLSQAQSLPLRAGVILSNFLSSPLFFTDTSLSSPAGSQGSPCRLPILKCYPDESLAHLVPHLRLLFSEDLEALHLAWSLAYQSCPVYYHSAFLWLQCLSGRITHRRGKRRLAPSICSSNISMQLQRLATASFTLQKQNTLCLAL